MARLNSLQRIQIYARKAMLGFNPWNPDGSYMAHYMPIARLFPSSSVQTWESGWVVYGPETGYNFPYLRLSRVNILYRRPISHTQNNALEWKIDVMYD